MISKYSALEIERLLDSINTKVSKFSVIQKYPSSLENKYSNFELFNADVVMQLIKDLAYFNISDKDAFINFANSLNGYSLLNNQRRNKIDRLSDNFLGTYNDISDITLDPKNGDFALILNDDTGNNNISIFVDNKWIWYNTDVQHKILSENETLNINILQDDFKFAKCYIHASNSKATNLLELNITKGISTTSWFVQLENVINKDIPIVAVLQYDISKRIPNVVIKALDTCEVFCKLEIKL